uniref:Uncharacterized protein n=1 Tax=Callorhinchus milii TaxID=7868 RepID=A0A4W3JN41_CALMI
MAQASVLNKGLTFILNHNLTKRERRALVELRECPDIVIKPADKGSSIVIMDRQQYFFEVHRQLNSNKYYRKLTKPIYKETQQEIKDILANLTKRESPRAHRFYILPKIHKNPDSWTVPGEIPPGRPIVSDCGSESYRVAEYIDSFLNPLSRKHPSYIKDTYHFIEKATIHDTPSRGN